MLTLKSDVFKIQNSSFRDWSSGVNADAFTIKSSPRPYCVEFISSNQQFSWLEQQILAQQKPLILSDSYVQDELLPNLKIGEVPTYRLEPTEENKDIATVLAVCDFLNQHKANRGSMLFVIGGGVVQDIGAFAAAMLKRGIPWTYVPTTLLAQGDSCLGGKTAVNHNKTKNLLGLFSAPRKVFIDNNFARTLSFQDRMSGGGEIFRLLITGGAVGAELLGKNIVDFVDGSISVTRQLVAASLQVKRLIVEDDEFELDIRRAMNYGHSIGHAIEALSNYKIPHGIGVAIGIFVENRIAVNRGMLSQAEERKIYEIGKKLVPNDTWRIFCNLDISKILPLLSSDKKAEGPVLKLATLQSIGHMVFVDLSLDENGLTEVQNAFDEVVRFHR
jgi:3-dehydroquinate synthase